MKTKVIDIKMTPDLNMIFGMTHFIKSVEDLYEAMVTSSASVEFGIAFCEASQDCLIRSDGNSEDLIKLAEKTAFDIACGHTFIIFMRNGYPINFLPRIKSVPEVCRIFCATANPVQVIVAETELGRGVMGVIDGQMPAGIETAEHKQIRHKFLRDIGYKR
ncbi:MAG: adenosine monophosphate-protein transferase [candidate division Zixibacteria bacterium HGW-Zixibacteria-1]|nr:MAG: adenosine monophosphate-protein transferase [candidate division Zixibacteria bacterium HGW-Zixibacteria-1]